MRFLLVYDLQIIEVLRVVRKAGSDRFLPDHLTFQIQAHSQLP